MSEAIDAMRKTMDYERGYSNGYKDGYTKALLSYQRNLDIARMSTPILVEAKNLPDEILNKIKDNTTLQQENKKLKEALKELLTIAKMEMIQTENTPSGVKWINKLNGIIDKSEELLKGE